LYAIVSDHPLDFDPSCDLPQSIHDNCHVVRDSSDNDLVVSFNSCFGWERDYVLAVGGDPAALLALITTDRCNPA
jgi:hypothetical protein